MRVQFSWGNPTTWPRDPPGYIFLARAFDEIGQAQFRENWIRKKRSTRPKNMDDDTWEEIEDDEDEKEDARLESMRAAIRQIIIEKCEAGVLKAALRRVRGGEMIKLDNYEWNAEHLDARFSKCQMNPEDPFAESVGGSSTHWIYLTRESLDKFLGSQPYAAAIALPGVHLSPYLRCMISVIKKLKITPDNQPTKESVVAEIRAIWTGEESLSGNKIEMMATLCREPESQSGRAKKPASRARKGYPQAKI